MARLLVIMGSGETAPTMVKPHRTILDRAGDGPAVLLDTPYGFQSNADDISRRAVGYFGASVGRQVATVPWRVAPSPGLTRERSLAALSDAAWIFAGPGSPTYALRHWHDTPIPALLAEKLATSGVVLFASAAALTLGSHTVPVYEIYKAGYDPHWVNGLDLVSAATGLPAVVIPHYDNAEGGHHDTRYCYLGEKRLSTMERELPDGTFVLGVDEHTAVVLDLDAGTATVVGNGGLTVRRQGHSVVHPAGAVLGFETLARGAGADPPGAPATTVRVAGDPAAPDPAARDVGPTVAPETSLRASADRIADQFGQAFVDRDVDGCVSAILDLEQTLLDWAADTLSSDEGDHARGVLRSMVVRLGELAVAGVRDPRDAVAPLVVALLGLRDRARDRRDFATSDRIREQLAEAGVEVQDTSDGVRWHLL